MTNEPPVRGSTSRGVQWWATWIGIMGGVVGIIVAFVGVPSLIKSNFPSLSDPPSDGEIAADLITRSYGLLIDEIRTIRRLPFGESDSGDALLIFYDAKDYRQSLGSFVDVFVRTKFQPARAFRSVLHERELADAYFLKQGTDLFVVINRGFGSAGFLDLSAYQVVSADTVHKLSALPGRSELDLEALTARVENVSDSLRITADGMNYVLRVDGSGYWFERVESPSDDRGGDLTGMWVVDVRPDEVLVDGERTLGTISLRVGDQLTLVTKGAIKSVERGRNLEPVPGRPGVYAAKRVGRTTMTIEFWGEITFDSDIRDIETVDVVFDINRDR